MLHPPDPPPNRRKTSRVRPPVAFLAFVCLALAGLTLAIYLQTRSFEYVTFDDNDYVYENLWIARGLTFHGVLWAFRALYINWHPLTWLSLMLDVSLFGLHPGPQHLVNVGLHLASAIALLLALMRLTGRTGRSALVAAIFAVHPLHVESVAWIAERKDVLSTFFELLALLFYASYARNRTPLGYAAVAVAFACSLMSKPMAVTFPFLLLLLDYWPLERISKPVVWEKVPLLAMSAVASVLTAFAQRGSGAVQSLAKAPPAERLANAVVACVWYMKKAVWPSNLGVFYPLRAHPKSVVLASLLIVITLTGAAIVWRRRQPWLFVGWFWYLGMLVPVIGLVQVGLQGMADRYTYLPLTGLSIAAIWIVADAVSDRFILRAVTAVLACAAILALAIVAHHQASFWKNSETLYEHTLAVTGPNYVMENNLGAVCAAQNRHFEAIGHYQKSIALQPDFAAPRMNLGAELLDHGRIDEAFTQLTAALRIDPNLPLAQANLGNVYLRRGDYPEARRLIEDSLQRLPDNSFAHGDLCILLGKTGESNKALDECRKALGLNPALREVRFHFAAILAAAGKKDEAIEEYSRLLAIDATYPGAREALEGLKK